MLEKEDIQKIITAQSEVFATKEDLADFRDEMKAFSSDIQSAIDGYAKKADAYFQEMLMLSNKIERHEKWLHTLADKLNVKLEY